MPGESERKEKSTGFLEVIGDWAGLRAATGQDGTWPLHLPAQGEIENPGIVDADLSESNEGTSKAEWGRHAARYSYSIQ